MEMPYFRILKLPYSPSPGTSPDGGDRSGSDHAAPGMSRLCSQPNTVCLHQRMLEHVQGRQDL